jgi:predicted nuclease with TOPRIM domain
MAIQLNEGSMKPKLKLSEEVVELRSEVDRLMSALQRAEKDAARRLDHIRLFKEERLDLDNQNAELRGYLARVLEDDRVREAKDLPPEPSPITHNMMEEARDVLRRADLFKSGAYIPMRMGPNSMHDASASGIGADYDNFGRQRTKPLSWQDRE